MAEHSNGNGGGRRVHFDPTINLGHAISATVFLITAGAAYATLDLRLTATTKALETKADRAELNRAESALVDKVRSLDTNAVRFELNYREDMRDLKVTLTRIEEKLDRKADKPGR